MQLTCSKTIITVIFDNYAYLPGFTPLWGFSAFIETDEYTILFDTGSNGRVLLQNMARLDIDPVDIDILFLSHPHWDHIGGIDSIIEANPHLDLVTPHSLSKHLINDLRKLCKTVTVVDKAPIRLLSCVWSTGTMSEVGEESLVIDTEKGLIVVTGCAHPGIVSIAERAVEILEKPIALLMGGFHLMERNRQEIADILRALDRLEIGYVSPSHCTGDLAIKMFHEHYEKRFIQGGIGQKISI